MPKLTRQEVQNFLAIAAEREEPLHPTPFMSFDLQIYELFILTVCATSCMVKVHNIKGS